jgi:hypothetical protein
VKGAWPLLLRMSTALVIGCSTPNGNERTALGGPDLASFGPVAAFLDHRCGSLDCHGTRYRNLRMWGHDGMRLAIGDVPGGSPTTPDELSASYMAIVELEPEVMAAVVHDHGANPERLTLVRKARGSEKHTGGAVVSPGDARDECILSWLDGATNATSCADALALP